MIYQFEMAFVVDGTRFRTRFGAPLDDAVHTTLGSYRVDEGSRALGR